MFDQRELHAPYPGLRSFEAGELAVFFGREAHVSRLVAGLHDRRFLSVIGPSGSGKSSLLRAGLLPALSMAWPGDVSDWRIAVMRPGERPLRLLAECLIAPEVLGVELGIATDRHSRAPTDPSHAALIEAEIRARPEALVEQVEDALRHRSNRPPINLMVLVDQFEELFRYAELGERQAGEAEMFVERLLAPGRSSQVAARRVFIALTMRTDALHDCARFLDLPEAINRAQYLVPRLKPDEMRRAIVGPATVFEGRVDDAVVEVLVRRPQRGADELPQIQHALSRMWTRACERDARRPRITLDDLRETGGVDSALSQHADGLFGRLTREQQELAEGLFRAVTGQHEGSQSDTRRPQRMDQILRAIGLPESECSRLAPIVRAFAIEGANFLSYKEPLGPDTVIDISHEALIRQWRRLKALVNFEATQAAEFRRWRERAESHARGDGELLVGADLLSAEAWLLGKTPTQAVAENPGEGEREVPVELADTDWTPTTGWAQRYARHAGAEELRTLREFVALSRESAEASRAKEEEAREREARMQLEAARERADAAERERLVAEQGRLRARRWTIAAAVVSALAILAAIFALQARFNAAKAEMKAQSALASVQSQRLAKSASQAIAGNAAAFAEIKESLDSLTRFVRGLKTGEDNVTPAPTALQGEVDKLLVMVDRTEKNALLILAQQRTLTGVGQSMRAINRQSADLLEAAETVSSLKLMSGASAAELSAAGQLVMLTQRIGKSANEFLTTEGVSPEAVFLLGKDLASFREIGQGLLEGNVELRLPGTKDPQTREKLRQLMEQYAQTRTQAGDILGNLQGLVAAREGQTSIVQDSEPLRRGLQEVAEGMPGVSVWLLALAGALVFGGGAAVLFGLRISESRKSR
jgi:energy-coupling factor transporter ATP-binding protein EcfA2